MIWVPMRVRGRRVDARCGKCELFAEDMVGLSHVNLGHLPVPVPVVPVDEAKSRSVHFGVSPSCPPSRRLPYLYCNTEHE